MIDSRTRFIFCASLVCTLAGTQPSFAQPPQTNAGKSLLAPINGTIDSPKTAAHNAWSLPICPSMGNEPVAPWKNGQESALKGNVTVNDEKDIAGKCISHLLDAALVADPSSKSLEKSVAHFRSLPMKMVAQAKDATNMTIPYQGFGPSSEAADIVLGEKLKLKSQASAEYARQKQVDELHVKVVGSVMQIAMGLGMADRARAAEIVASGADSLRALVGEEEAKKTVAALTDWSKQVTVPSSVFEQGVWDVEQRHDKFKNAMTGALDNDPVVQEIQRRLHKYNRRSTFARVSAHVVESALGIAGMAPDFIGAAGKAALTTFIMATGGPEQAKVLKELYLDKRFESRWKVLNEETHLALDNYHVAILTHNSVLLAFSESLVKDNSTSATVSKVFGQSVLDHL